MTLNLQLPMQEQAMQPVITVIGVGGAGGNAVNNMISAQLEGVQFVVANTDAQSLESALTDRNIQLGRNITQGLGAGANPEIGQAAAEEAADEIGSCIEGSHMVFITAGMGGGTGTGAAPVVARMAREQGMLTVGVVTKPFQFEGGNRMRLADQGISELQKYVDTLIVIPNQNLFRIANEKTTFADAFRMADEVLHSGVRGVTDLMVKPGLVNLDFADIRTIMQEMGKAMMGTGEASGEKRAVEASEAAISNPLLDDVSLRGAKAALINITGGADMTLYEVDEAANRIREEIDADANIIFGSTFHEAMQGTMRVSVVATGIDADPEQYKAPMGTAEKAPRSQFSRPAAAKPAARQGGGYFGGAQANAKSHNKPTSSGYVTRDNPANADMAIDTNQDFNPRTPQNRPAGPRGAEPAHAGRGGFEAVDERRPGNQPVQDAAHEQDGPLFVSPNAGRPASREHQQDAYDAPRQEEERGQQAYGIFNRIADVGRSFNSRHEQEPQQARTVEVTERHHEQQGGAAHQEEPEQDNYQDYREHEEESVYDIPAFLRRQPN